MNSNDKKVSFALLFERSETPKVLCEVSRFSEKADGCGNGYVTFVCNLTEFKEFLKEVPVVCKNVGTEIKLYGRVNTDANNCTFFNYLIDEHGIKEGDAQVISKNPEQNIPYKEENSIERKEVDLCY